MDRIKVAEANAPSTFFQRWRELILGVVMLFIAAVYAYNIQFIRVRANVRVSAKLIPEMLAILMLGLAILQTAKGTASLLDIRRKNALSGVPAVFLGKEERLSLWPVALTFIIIGGYALAFGRLGFVVSSTVCIFVQTLALAPRGRTRPLLFLLVASASSAIIYAAFRFGLDLTLPQGILEGAPYM